MTASKLTVEEVLARLEKRSLVDLRNPFKLRHDEYDVLRAALTSGKSQGWRDDVLEEAAKVAEGHRCGEQLIRHKMSHVDQVGVVSVTIAKAIRALKSPPLQGDAQEEGKEDADAPTHEQLRQADSAEGQDGRSGQAHGETPRPEISPEEIDRLTASATNFVKPTPEKGKEDGDLSLRGASVSADLRTDIPAGIEPQVTPPTVEAQEGDTGSRIKQENTQPRIGPRYQKTFCSQCGSEFGPGDSGYSHCDQHLKRGASLSFVGGILNLNASGCCNDGSGSLCFADDDLRHEENEEGRLYRYIELQKAELIAVRDFLNTHLTASSPTVQGEPICEYCGLGSGIHHTDCKRPALPDVGLVLPDCMMPDGADPCKGYQQTCAALETALRERDEERAMGNGWHKRFKAQKERADAAQDEIRRLRAGLEAIADLPLPHEQSAVAMARAALTGAG